MKARLRTCARCEWIFEQDGTLSGCPRCGFAHYGARWVYGRRAYRYARTQEPWLNKKVAHYKEALWREIRESERRRDEPQ